MNGWCGRLAYFGAVLFLFVSVISVAHGQAAPAMEPISMGPIRPAPGSGVMATVSYRNPANAKIYSQVVNFPRSRMVGLARGVIGGPAGLAITAALMAAGYFLDNGVPWSRTFEHQSPEVGNLWRFHITNFIPDSGGHFDPAIDGYLQSLVGYHGLQDAFRPLIVSPHSIHFQSVNDGRGYIQIRRGSAVRGVFWFDGYRGAADQSIPYGRWVERPVNDNEIATLLEQNPHLGRDLLLRPNGQPLPTPEVVQAGNDLLADWLAKNNIDPESVTFPDPVADSSLDPTAPGSVIETDFPPFCTYAEIVCTFIDWFRDPPILDDAPDLPVVDEGQETSWQSGMAGGQCPTPATFQVAGRTLELSWALPCEFAELLRPIVLFMAWLSAAFILSGYRRSN